VGGMEQSGARACVRAFRLQLKMHSPTVAEAVLDIIVKKCAGTGSLTGHLSEPRP
jgi:hypothetical protein